MSGVVVAYFLCLLLNRLGRGLVVCLVLFMVSIQVTLFSCVYLYDVSYEMKFDMKLVSILFSALNSGHFVVINIFKIFFLLTLAL